MPEHLFLWIELFEPQVTPTARQRNVVLFQDENVPTLGTRRLDRHIAKGHKANSVEFGDVVGRVVLARPEHEDVRVTVDHP